MRNNFVILISTDISKGKMNNSLTSGIQLIFHFLCPKVQEEEKKFANER